MKISNILKGFTIGASMLIPGVSGGTMAMMLGIYDKLLSSISCFFDNKKANFIFLLTFGAGGLLGIATLSKPLLFLYETFPFLISFFFIGAIIGSVPLTFKEAKITKFKLSHLAYMLLGVMIIVGLSFLPENLFTFAHSGLASCLLLILAGFIAAIALVLPGISISYMLLVMGIYEPIIKAIDELNIIYLLLFGVGLLAGVIATTKSLELLLTKHTQKSYLVILGFVLASIIELFPGIPTGLNILFCSILAVAGFIIIYTVSNLQISKKTE